MVCGFGAQTGYIIDTESGLMLLTHRYYDPIEGRFLNRDPIGYSGGLNRTLARQYHSRDIKP